MTSVKNHSPGPGRPPGLTRRAADQRRMQCYDLYLKGFSEPQIASSLQLHHSSVSRYLSSVRNKNAEWFESTKDPHNRYRGMFKLALDRVEQVVREQWWNYHHTPEDKTTVRSEILNRILDAVAVSCKILGLTAAEVMDVLYFQEEFDKLHEKVEEGKRKILEMQKESQLAGRVLPFPQARLPPPPQ